MSALALPFPWNDFHQFQSRVNGRTCGPVSFGREEALTDLLDYFGPDSSVRDSESLHRQFDNLCRNRAAKHRHRLSLVKRLAMQYYDMRIVLPGRGPLSKDHVGMVATRELLSLVRSNVSDAEWWLLWMLAEGYSYGEIAERCGEGIENLRSLVCRIRDRIRNSNVGRELRAALF